MGFISHEKFNACGDTVIESMKEFRKEVMQVYIKFAPAFRDWMTPDSGKQFERAADNLIPILTFRDDRIYVLHPAFLGFLAEVDEFDLLTRPNLLVDMITLFGYQRRDVRFSMESDRLQDAGINKNKLLRCIGYVNNSIQYSRILKR